MNFDINRLQDADVVDQNGDKVGTVGQVYVDDQTNQPSFVTVKTGLFGNKETFVPLNAAQQTERGIEVPYTKDFIKDAPNLDADGHISEQEEADIERYYQGAGFGNQGDRAGYVDGDNSRRDVVDGDRRDYVDTNDRRDVVDGNRADYVGNDRRDVVDNNDGSVVRHEEQLNVGKERVQTGRVRLRKYVVTEQKTVTVPVEREEVQVVREPIADGDNVGDGRLGEDEQVVTLSEERPVVDKQVVAKERVGLQTNTVTDQQQVQAEVGREEVSVDRDGDLRDGVDNNRGFTDGQNRDYVDGDNRDYTDGNNGDGRSFGQKVKDTLHGDKDGDGVKDKYEN